MLKTITSEEWILGKQEPKQGGHCRRWCIRQEWSQWWWKEEWIQDIFWKMAWRGLTGWSAGLGGWKRRINLSNCMNYTRGSQTFSVHNTLNISVNFSQCPLSKKKHTMIFIYYLSPRNLINTCVTFLLSYECIFMLKLNTQKLKEKNNAFTYIGN